MKSKELKVQEIFIWVVQSALIRQDPRGVFLSLLKEHEGASAELNRIYSIRLTIEQSPCDLCSQSR